MLLSATVYTDWLTTALREAVRTERAASAEPIAMPTVRFQCPHCRRTWAKQKAAAAHIARCWHNPDVKACKTCIYLIPPCDGPYPEHPGWPEDCELGLLLADVPNADCHGWSGNR